MIDIEERRLIDVEQASNQVQTQTDEDRSSALAAGTGRPASDRDNANGSHTGSSSIDGHEHGHEHVKLASKHYLSIIAVGWIFGVVSSFGVSFALARTSTVDPSQG